MARLRSELRLFGRTIVISCPVGAPAQPDPDLAHVVARDEAQLRPLAGDLGHRADRLELGPFGRLRLAQAALDGLGIPLAEVGTTDVATALDRGSWSEAGRAAALCALLRGVGLAAQLLADRSRVLVGVPVEDGPEAFDGLRLELELHGRVGGVATSRRMSWLAWDGRGVIGGLPPDGPLRGVLPSATLLEGPAGAIRFAARVLPEACFEQPGTGRLIWGPEDVSSFHHFPSVADFVAPLAAARFPAAVRLAREELRPTGLVDVVSRRWSRLPDEVGRVQALLQAVQASLRHLEAPNGSIHALLAAGGGSAETLSVLVAALLLELGWSEQRVVGLRFPGHFMLGLSPSGTEPTGVSAFEVGGRRYVPFDPTHRPVAPLPGLVAPPAAWGRVDRRHFVGPEVVRV